MARLVTVFAAAISMVPPASAWAYGEATATGPSNEERLLLVLSNQVRQAPHDWPGWDTTLATRDARRPLAHHPGLITAARGHAEDMATQGFFAHESSDGTTFQARTARFFRGPAGENIYKANAQGAAEAITAWMGSTTGHRENLLDGSWDVLGTGHATAGGQHYYVQDFGTQGAGEAPALPAGATRTRADGRLELLTNFYDADGRPPKSVEAVLGNLTVSLPQVAGETGNETRAATVTMPDRCELLVFVAVDAGDRVVSYPDTGSLLAGSGCPADFDPTNRPPSAPGGAGRPIIDADGRGCTCTVRPEDPAGVWMGALGLLLFRRKMVGRSTAR